MISPIACLGLLLLSERHRIREIRDGLTSDLAAWLKFRVRGGIYRGVPNAAFGVVLVGLVAGHLGFVWGFSLAGAFMIADKLITHVLLRLPGDTGWWTALFGAVLVWYEFNPLGAALGVGLLVGLFPALWLLGAWQRWRQ